MAGFFFRVLWGIAVNKNLDSKEFPCALGNLAKHVGLSQYRYHVGQARGLLQAETRRLQLFGNRTTSNAHHALAAAGIF